MEQQSCCMNKNEKPLGEAVVLYKPLIIIFLISFGVAVALNKGWNIFFMDTLMGMFLCFLATLQLFNLSGYAESFARYDIVAKRFRGYGTAFPFIELGLGLLYLSSMWPIFTNLAMLAVMVVSNIGVFQVLRSGAKVQCACAGTGFNLPVGRVTFFENAVMGLMAAINLLQMAL